MVALLISYPAAAKQERWSGWKNYETRYLNKYDRAHDQGHYLGANIVDDSNPSRAHVLTDTAEITALMHPPPAPEPVAAPSEPAAVTPTYTPPATSSGGCPASMAPESGSAGYGAYNPSSGATGCYQILGSTAAAYGCDLSTPGGQDSCAAAICEGQGSGAWASSGANPC